MHAVTLDIIYQKLRALYTESWVFLFIGAIGAVVSTFMYLFDPALTFLWYLYALSLSILLIGGATRRLFWIERRLLVLTKLARKKIKERLG